MFLDHNINSIQNVYLQFTAVANDQGFPPKYGRIVVTIRVDRDQFRPVFQNVEVNVTIHDTMKTSLLPLYQLMMMTLDR